MNFHEPINFDQAIKMDIPNKYLAHEKEINEKNKNIYLVDDIAFFVGPEGGFDEEEIKKAKEQKIKILSLGKRILRSETAAIYLLSNIIETD